MSLRDQLLRAGLVSKKAARRAEQEKRKAARRAKGSQEKKARRAAREAAERAEAEARRARELAARRRERQAIEDRYARALKIRQILRAHELRGGGPVRYRHRTLDGSGVHTLALPEAVARSLARGRAAIAAEDMGRRVRYLVVSEIGAARLRELAPEVLVDPGPPPAEGGPVARDWLPDLRARRATPEDLARWRARASSG